ncbi:hypothetical protein SAURM35S_03101 [Streptomyces aurantiogriseus]
MCDDLPAACLYPVHSDPAEERKAFAGGEYLLSCLFQGVPDADVTNGQHEHPAQVGDGEGVGTDWHQERDAYYRRPPVLIGETALRGYRSSRRHQGKSPWAAATISARWLG